MEGTETSYEINDTTYLVSTHFSEGEESVLDKIERLICEEVENAELPVV